MSARPTRARSARTTSSTSASAGSSADGRFDGVVGISAYVEYFANYYRSLGLPEDDFAIALVRDDGNVLVRYPQLGGSSSKIPPDSPLLSNLTGREQGTFFARSPFTGQDRLYGFMKVRGYPVYAFYGINERAITAEWLQTDGLGGERRRHRRRLPLPHLVVRAAARPA